MHATPRNIHALVRILKAPSDPPSADGPLKIDIANDAWLDASFGAVKKAEVLVEWLLGALGRDGKRSAVIHRQYFLGWLTGYDRASGNGPLSNPKYWSLPQQTLSSSVSSVRPLKTWLIPLLHRTNLAGMVKELIITFRTSATLTSVGYMYLRVPCSQYYGRRPRKEWEWMVYWNASLPYWAFVDPGAEALGTFGNKKKLYTGFLSIHMSHWIRTLSPSVGSQFFSTHPSREDPSSKTPKKLYETLYRAGVDTLFSCRRLQAASRHILGCALARGCGLRLQYPTMPLFCTPWCSESLPDNAFLRASEVYVLLMYVPPEYFTRTSRTELVKRAVSGDVAICSVLLGANDGGDVDSPQLADGGCDMDIDKESGSEVHMFRELCVRHLTIFRAFLYRIGQFMNGLGYTTSCAYVEHLLQPPRSSALSSDALTEKTLNLVAVSALQLSTLLRAQNPEAVMEAIKILNCLLLLGHPPTYCHQERGHGNANLSDLLLSDLSNV
ncbi:hypothetical protein F5141DRAFT_1209544 [Pisolithus sp. B1]|nr:hypothetical protein F5141DRAFT_1209544 [Pisolithus sp. B1]